MFKVKHLALARTILLALILSIPAYYCFNLPSEEILNSDKTAKDVFLELGVSSDEQIVSESELPPKAFKCSLCYPEDTSSTNCKNKILVWVSKNIANTAEPQKQIWFSLKTAILGKVLSLQYSDETLFRLYMTFANRQLQSLNISESCKLKFDKKCSDLNNEEAVKLEFAVRGNVSSDTTELQKTIFDKCNNYGE